ncbi:MAG: ribonuclease P protein component [Anaerosomatales bacterium]
MRTIRSNREIDEVFRTGARVSHPLVIALTRQTPAGRGPEGRVAFVAGKKLGNAVKRNRSKRVMRAAMDRAGGPWPGTDVVLIARPSTATAPPSQLDDAVAAVSRAVGAGR